MRERGQIEEIFELVDEIERQTPSSFETILGLYGFSENDSMKSEQNIKIMISKIKDWIMPMYPYELVQLIKKELLTRQKQQFPRPP